MNNTKKKNLEYQITSCETNLRYLLGGNPIEEKKVSYMRKEIKRCKKELANLEK